MADPLYSLSADLLWSFNSVSAAGHSSIPVDLPGSLHHATGFIGDDNSAFYHAALENVKLSVSLSDKSTGLATWMRFL